MTKPFTITTISACNKRIFIVIYHFQYIWSWIFWSENSFTRSTHKEKWKLWGSNSFEWFDDDLLLALADFYSHIRKIVKKNWRTKIKLYGDPSRPLSLSIRLSRHIWCCTRPYASWTGILETSDCKHKGQIPVWNGFAGLSWTVMAPFLKSPERKWSFTVRYVRKKRFLAHCIVTTNMLSKE